MNKEIEQIIKSAQKLSYLDYLASLNMCAKCDGFDSWEEMKKWFNEPYRPFNLLGKF